MPDLILKAPNTTEPSLPVHTGQQLLFLGFPPRQSPFSANRVCGLLPHPYLCKTRLTQPPAPTPCLPHLGLLCPLTELEHRHCSSTSVPLAWIGAASSRVTATPLPPATASAFGKTQPRLCCSHRAPWKHMAQTRALWHCTCTGPSSLCPPLSKGCMQPLLPVPQGAQKCCLLLQEASFPEAVHAR
jgi:hypothetical protein